MALLEWRPDPGHHPSRYRSRPPRPASNHRNQMDRAGPACDRDEVCFPEISDPARMGPAEIELSSQGERAITPAATWLGDFDRRIIGVGAGEKREMRSFRPSSKQVDRDCFALGFDREDDRVAVEGGVGEFGGPGVGSVDSPIRRGRFGSVRSNDGRRLLAAKRDQCNILAGRVAAEVDRRPL